MRIDRHGPARRLGRHLSVLPNAHRSGTRAGFGSVPVTRNRVALSFLPNMRGDLDPVERVLHVTMAFQLQDDSEGLRRFFAFWVVEGRLQVAQQVDLNRRLKEMGMPEIIEWWLEEGHAKGRLEGLEEGIRASKREDARKMMAEGCEWSFITRITDIRPEDLI